MSTASYIPKFTVNAANEMQRLAELNDWSGEAYNEMVVACKRYAISQSNHSATLADERKVLCGDVTHIAETKGWKV